MAIDSSLETLIVAVALRRARHVFITGDSWCKTIFVLVYK